MVLGCLQLHARQSVRAALMQCTPGCDRLGGSHVVMFVGLAAQEEFRQYGDQTVVSTRKAGHNISRSLAGQQLTRSGTSGHSSSVLRLRHC